MKLNTFILFFSLNELVCDLFSLYMTIGGGLLIPKINDYMH